MVVVQRPERVETAQAGRISLLPVDPPEIDAFVLQRMVQVVEIRFYEPLVSMANGTRSFVSGSTPIFSATAA
jgi:hypothetical protein